MAMHQLISCKKANYKYSYFGTEAWATLLTVLQHQAILLEKDKQIAAVSEELQSKQEEVRELSNNIQVVDNNNAAMQMVVSECERIIAQIGDERSKEMLDIMVTKEKVKKESEQANEDLQVRSLKEKLMMTSIL